MVNFGQNSVSPGYANIHIYTLYSILYLIHPVLQLSAVKEIDTPTPHIWIWAPNRAYIYFEAAYTHCININNGFRDGFKVCKQKMIGHWEVWSVCRSVHLSVCCLLSVCFKFVANVLPNAFYYNRSHLNWMN